ncbi:MAG: hypothetical protein LAO20_07145 [Acidobacteriia bacterium]|nr:hypothetical protein [Terriglobia bacterium]
MRKFKLAKWLAEVGILFFVFIAFDSLRKLHALGQPILGTIIESLAISAIASVFLYFWEDRSNE